MKLNSMAFTLVELLGVVIILGLLVTLIFPSIINSIKKSSDEASNVTEQLATNAADLYIRDNKRYYDVSNGDEFCISLSDLVSGNYLKSPLNYSDIDDITNTYSVKVTYDDQYNYELIENNKCPDPIYVAKTTPTTGIIPTIDSKGDFVPGSEFSIKVSDTIGYLTFFVLSNDGDYVNLIAEQNITIDGQFTSETQANDEWYVTTSSTYDNRYGPQTAYTYLSTATSGWTNIPKIESFTYEDEGYKEDSTYGYQSVVTTFDNTTGNYITTITPLSSDYGNPVTYENMRARLPKYIEVTATEVGCTTTYGECPIWMVNYLAKSGYYSTDHGKTNSTGNNYGYWLLSSTTSVNYNACVVNYSGNVSTDNTNSTTRGIRPVITVPKVELIRAMK